MSRAKPFAFLRALRSLNVDLAPLDPAEDSLAARPRRLFQRLEKLGYAIEHARPSAAVLRGFGFRPRTVFDIGVHAGTPLIYRSFPDARFLLIDPMAECEARIAKWRERIDLEFHCCALGAEEGETEINLPVTGRRRAVARASVRDFAPGYREGFESVEKRTVPLRRLDSLAAAAEPPFGIKIDTEGYELEVIQGAEETLKRTEFVIAEVSVRQRFAGGYRFSELVGALGRHGFEPLDFLRPLRPDSPDCDLLFARYDGPHFAL